MWIFWFQKVNAICELFLYPWCPKNKLWAQSLTGVCWSLDYPVGFLICVLSSPPQFLRVAMGWKVYSKYWALAGLQVLEVPHFLGQFFHEVSKILCFTLQFIYFLNLTRRFLAVSFLLVSHLHFVFFHGFVSLYFLLILSPHLNPKLYWSMIERQKLYIFKVHNVMNWYTYTLWSGCHNQGN